MFKKLRKIHKKKITIVAQDNRSYKQLWNINSSKLILNTTLILIILVLILLGVYLGKIWSDMGKSIKVETEENVLKNNNRIDSLRKQLLIRDYYLNDFIKVLNGKKFADSMIHLMKPNSIDTLNFNFSNYTNDSLLKIEIEKDQSRNKKSIKINEELTELFFFSPINGLISQSFNTEKKHYGVDVSSVKNETIKAVLSGYVIYAGWTQNDGYMIIINHQNGLVSIYKHNSSLLKSIGEKVMEGDAIAIIGNSGELSDGPHLHFELWWNGKAIDPQDYISFN